METKQLGAWGEALALTRYKKNRYKAVAMGYRSRYGEIDLIVESRECIVFIEVKTRKNDAFAKAREYVDTRKQERIRQTAAIWLSENDTEKQPRFDVVEIYAPDGINTRKPELNIYENAF